jgi:hypothetical protein
MTKVRGIVSVAHGGCAASPPTIRHNDETRAWQTYGAVLETLYSFGHIIDDRSGPLRLAHAEKILGEMLSGPSQTL